MRHPLNWLLRIGRSDSERLALLGDLAEERAGRLARGSSSLSTFVWYTTEILAAFVRAVWDHRPRRPSRPALIGDVRYALRRWRHRPGFAATAVITLALGIAAATSIFSVVDAVLLKPLPWTSPESLVVVHGLYPKRRANPATAATWNRGLISYPAWDALHTAPAFEFIGAWRAVQRKDMTIGDSRDEIVTTLDVSSMFLPMLGVPLSAGRYFNGDEDRLFSESIILTHETWRRTFGGRAGIVGTRVMLGSASTGEQYPKTVVGIIARGFKYEGVQPDVLQPIGIGAQTMHTYPSPALRVVARLAKNASVESADAQAASLAAGAANDEQGTARVIALEDDQLGTSRRPLLLLFGGAGILLLLACSNVAGLLLGDARLRRHEIAVRSALGSSKGRIVRQLVVEHALLACAASIVGVIAAYWCTGALVALAPAGMPRIETTAIDLRSITFAIGLGVVTLMTFGIAPAVSLARVPVAGVLADSGRGGSPGAVAGQRVIVVAQVALALVLLTGAMLFGETMIRLRALPLGFDPAGVGVISTTFTGNQFGDPAAVKAAWKQPNAGQILSLRQTATTVARVDAVLERVAAVPGVTHASASSAAPFIVNPVREQVVPDGRADAVKVEALRQTVTIDYFAAMNIPLVGGRGFERANPGGDRIAIVSAEFERRAFPSGAIGQTFRLFYGAKEDLSIPYRVVGVVANVKRQDPTDDDRPAFYVDYRQGGATSTHIIIRSGGDPANVLPAVRRAIADASPQMVVTSMATLSSRVGQSITDERFRASLSGLFGAAALLLAAVGLYGLAARRVADRRREFGVRVALGARPRDVRRLVLRDAAVILAIGLAVGLPLAIGTARIARSMLFGVSSTAPHVFAATALLLSLVVTTATILPARRAGRVDPVTALKQ